MKEKIKPNRLDLREYGVFPVLFDELYDREGFDLEDPLCSLGSDIKMSARIYKEKQFYTMDFEIRFLLKARCARCLENIDIDVNRAERVFLFDGPFKGTETNIDLDEEELDHYYLDDLILDMDDFTNEQVVVSIPLKILCRAECRGICPGCGKDLNLEDCKCRKGTIDPRWEKLIINK